MAVTKFQALPKTREGWHASRILKRRLILVDYIEPIVGELWENPEFIKYVDPMNDEEAVEGDIDIDYVKAAEMIRDYAIEHKIAIVAKHNLKAIRTAFKRVLWRHHNSIAQREREPDTPTNDPSYKKPKKTAEAEPAQNEQQETEE